MSRTCSSLLGLLAAGVLLSMSGCARDLQLVQITVTPPTATFLAPDPAGQIQFTALGTYIHPPGTRDITNEVTWKTDIPQLLNVTPAGLVSPTGGCGIANIIASTNKHTLNSKNVVVGFASVTVNDSANPICPGGSTAHAVLTVIVAGTGIANGSVTSTPAGINCPAQACGAQFNVGVPITLTPAVSSGATLGGWANCPQISGNSCIVTLTQDTSVTATFN